MTPKTKRSVVKKQLLRVVRDDQLDPSFTAAVAGDRLLTRAEKTFLRKWRRQRGDGLYADLIFSITNTYFPHDRASELWAEILAHQQALGDALGRNVGVVVAAHDYLTNIRCLLGEATLMPSKKLAMVAEIAVKDGLTGLFDHATFHSRLGDETRRYSRYGDAFSILMGDLDDFKAVNDTHGHTKGDWVLRKVGAILSKEARSTDLAARYGGEELALLAPRTPVREAEALAERIRKRVQRAFARSVGVTISLGVAACPNHGEDDVTLIQAADRALYRAKRQGKNRVVAA